MSWYESESGDNYTIAPDFDICIDLEPGESRIYLSQDDLTRMLARVIDAKDYDRERREF